MTTGVSHTTSVRVVKIGDRDHTVLSSNDPWYRYLGGLAGLFIAWEIDATDIDAMLERFGSDIEWRGDPAAKALARHIGLAMIEPDCPCDPYRQEPCACVPMNRRRRLADLMGVPYLEPLAGTNDDGREGLCDC